jgi:hypothetical protein
LSCRERALFGISDLETLGPTDALTEFDPDAALPKNQDS